MKKIVYTSSASIKINCLLSLFILLIISSCNNTEQLKTTIENRDTVSTIAQVDSSIAISNKPESDCEKLLVNAKKMDSTLLKALEVKPDIATKAIKAFTNFVYFCSNDSLCPIYLIKTAQVAQAVNNIAQAKVALDKCITNYPESVHQPAALFLLAQLYDEVNYLNDEKEAKILYQKIIKNYPKSDWAKSAKGALSFIGKTDDEIMQQLKKK